MQCLVLQCSVLSLEEEYFFLIGFWPMAKLLPMVLLIVALCFVFYTQVTLADDSTDESKDRVIAAKKYINCGAACNYRCSKANLHKRCLKYCNICCGKCKCVPPGTAGNREVCPCYNTLMNSRGGHKCP